MQVTVYGCGYVGLVTAALLADAGNHVVAVDIDADKIQALRQGHISIYEPGLATVVRRNLASQRLQFSTDIHAGASFGKLQFIAVGTPSDTQGAADLQYVLQVARQIGEYLLDDSVIINKSTVPVGTADKVKAVIDKALAQRGVTLNIAVVSNPEFLKEGAAITDFMKPDRIIIGSEDTWAIALMRELYAPFNRNHERIMVMDAHSAELTKYAANALLASKISFINEIASIAEAVGADIEKVRRGIGSDPRIGYDFIYAGCGYGGSCFPKDIRALNHVAEAHQLTLKLIPAVSQINDAQKQLLFTKIQRYFQGKLSGKHLAIWGLAFKANTDDLREAPSLTLLEALWSAGVSTTVYDPKAMPMMKKHYPNQPLLFYAEDALSCCQSADALVIVTDWREFNSPNFDDLQQYLKAPIIFDGRNLYSPTQMQQRGFRYFAIGRGESL